MKIFKKSQEIGSFCNSKKKSRHYKYKRVSTVKCWNCLITGSQEADFTFFFFFFTNIAFSDIIWLVHNHPQWEYLQHRNQKMPQIRNLFFREPVIKTFASRSLCMYQITEPKVHKVKIHRTTK